MKWLLSLLNGFLTRNNKMKTQIEIRDMKSLHLVYKVYKTALAVSRGGLVNKVN